MYGSVQCLKWWKATCVVDCDLPRVRQTSAAQARPSVERRLPLDDGCLPKPVAISEGEQGGAQGLSGRPRAGFGMSPAGVGLAGSSAAGRAPRAAQDGRTRQQVHRGDLPLSPVSPARRAERVEGQIAICRAAIEAGPR